MPPTFAAISRLFVRLPARTPTTFIGRERDQRGGRPRGRPPVRAGRTTVDVLANRIATAARRAAVDDEEQSDAVEEADDWRIRAREVEYWPPTCGSREPSSAQMNPPSRATAPADVQASRMQRASSTRARSRGWRRCPPRSRRRRPRRRRRVPARDGSRRQQARTWCGSVFDRRRRLGYPPAVLEAQSRGPRAGASMAAAGPTALVDRNRRPRPHHAGESAERQE